MENKGGVPDSNGGKKFASWGSVDQFWDSEDDEEGKKELC